MERQGQIVLADGKTQEEVEEQAVALILGEKKPEPGEKETAEKPKKVSAFCNFWREIAVSDMVIGILGLCAIGLIIIPELVYVRDIYEESYARSNTMFKLTYQAFILFGICMSYIITRFLLWKKERILQVFGGIGLVLLLSDLRLFWNERVLLVRKYFRSVRVPRTRCDSVSGKCLFRGRRCHPLAG